MRHEVVIVAYGVSPHLGDCIRSLRQQTSPFASLRIATSTANDHVVGTAASHGVEVLTNPVSGGGIAADWNFALASSAAEYVTLAHQDDLYEPTYSERMVAAMVRHADSLIGFCDFREVDPDGYCWDSINNKVKRLLTKRAFGSRETIGNVRTKRKLLSLGNPVCCPSVVFNRSRLGRFEFPSGFRSNLDWAAWLQLSERDGSFVYVREALVKKRNHSLSATAALIDSCHRLHEDRRMFERFWPRPMAALLMQFYKLGYLGNEKASAPQGRSA